MSISIINVATITEDTHYVYDSSQGTRVRVRLFQSPGPPDEYSPYSFGGRRGRPQPVGRPLSRNVVSDVDPSSVSFGVAIHSNAPV